MSDDATRSHAAKTRMEKSCQTPIPAESSASLFESGCGRGSAESQESDAAQTEARCRTVADAPVASRGGIGTATDTTGSSPHATPDRVERFGDLDRRTLLEAAFAYEALVVSGSTASKELAMWNAVASLLAHGYELRRRKGV